MIRLVGTKNGVSKVTERNLFFLLYIYTCSKNMLHAFTDIKKSKEIIYTGRLMIDSFMYRYTHINVNQHVNKKKKTQVNVHLHN